MAYGNDAKFKDGDRLESCGYGPDEQLAVNSGLFKGYRRSSESPDSGPDDWMVISGYARGGDSGGPVFNAKGRVVGVLWGTDGSEVVCVQPGRLHVLLNEAVAAMYEERALEERQAIARRNPTPPVYGPLVPIEGLPDSGGESCPGGQCDIDQARAGQKKPLLPWRGEAEAQDRSQDARIDRLIGLMKKPTAAIPFG